MAVYATTGLTFKVGASGGDATNIVKDVNSLDVKLKGETKTWNPLDQDGWQRTLMTGKSLTISHKGERNEGDTGNDMVAALADKMGDDCKLAYELDFPSGAKITGTVVVDISTLGGSNSTDVSALEWDAIFDGKPTFTAASTGS